MTPVRYPDLVWWPVHLRWSYILLRLDVDYSRGVPWSTP